MNNSFLLLVLTLFLCDVEGKDLVSLEQIQDFRADKIIFLQDLNNLNEYITARWIDPPVEPKLKIYIFNFTNPEEFLQGAKPDLVELGPYVFQ